MIGVVPGASARVTTLTINDNEPAFSGATFGSVGPYEVITGTFTDEIDSSDPHNAVIVDIEQGASRKAARPGLAGFGLPGVPS